MLKEYILSDYKRCGIQKISIGALLYTFYIQPNPGLKFMTIFRLTQHYRRKNRLLFYFFFLWLRRLKFKYGFDISYRTQIGKGFYIGHFGNVVIHAHAEIALPVAAHGVCGQRDDRDPAPWLAAGADALDQFAAVMREHLGLHGFHHVGPAEIDLWRGGRGLGCGCCHAGI
mgnify:CR=1 FL=1